MGCLRLPLVRNTLFTSLGQLYPPSVVTTPDLTNDIFYKTTFHRRESRLSRRSTRTMLKRSSQSIHRSRSHLVFRTMEEVELSSQLSQTAQPSSIPSPIPSEENDSYHHHHYYHHHHHYHPENDGIELVGIESEVIRRPMSANNLTDLDDDSIRKSISANQLDTMGMDGLIIDGHSPLHPCKHASDDENELNGQGWETMRMPIISRNSNDIEKDIEKDIENENYDYEEEEEDGMREASAESILWEMSHIPYNNQTYELNVVEEIVLPPSVQPSPSPSPTYRKSEFSPIPSKSPLPSDTQTLEEEEKALEVSVDGKPLITRFTESTVMQLLSLKDYTALSDYLCVRTLQQESIREQYETARRNLPSLFAYETVIESTSYEKVCEEFVDADWWQTRYDR